MVSSASQSPVSTSIGPALDHLPGRREPVAVEAGAVGDAQRFGHCGDPSGCVARHASRVRLGVLVRLTTASRRPGLHLVTAPTRRPRPPCRQRWRGRRAPSSWPRAPPGPDRLDRSPGGHRHPDHATGHAGPAPSPRCRAGRRSGKRGRARRGSSCRRDRRRRRSRRRWSTRVRGGSAHRRWTTDVGRGADSRRCRHCSPSISHRRSERCADPARTGSRRDRPTADSIGRLLEHGRVVAVPGGDGRLHPRLRSGAGPGRPGRRPRRGVDGVASSASGAASRPSSP